MDRDALPPSLATLLDQGALFEGKYRMLRAIGQGSFASVIHARHEAMDRDVALKVLRPDVIEDHPDVGERFLTESRLASRLTSAHTVMIYDFGQTDESVPYMVLEYVDGRELDYVIDKYDGLSLKKSIRITLQILESLEEAHSHSIIHRDLKPANVMVGKGMKRETEGVHVKVLDFGVAKLVEETEEGGGVEVETDESGRHSTQFIGTPRYMSPEQILGREVSPASDIYSLGLIFYEMCTGRASIPEDNVAKVAQQHLSRDRLELAAVEQLPSVLTDIIHRATARNPEDRFQEAAEFRDALQEALQEGRKRNRKAKTPATAPTETAEESEGPERTSDVFSGEGYIEMPDQQEVAESVSSTGSGANPVQPPSPGKSRSSLGSSGAGTTESSPRPPSSTGSRSRGASSGGIPGSTASDQSRPPSGSGELELDMEATRGTRGGRSNKNREEFAQKATAAENRPEIRHWVGGGLGVVAAGFVGFVIVGGALARMGFFTRLVMGLFPVGLALVWAVFSRVAYRDLARRIVIPWAKRAGITAVASIVVLAVVMPAEASHSLQQDAIWFMSGWPEGAQMGWLVGLTEAICAGASALMELIAGVIPWSE